MQDAPPPLPHLTNYEVIDRIGQGGMGSVFLGKRHGTNDLSIIKVINEDLLDNETVALRFVREAHVASNLHHGNIARLIDAGRDDGRIYLVMEFIQGHEFEALMRTLLAQGKMIPPGLTLTIAQDVLQALHYAHELADSNGQHLAIVHRDLSPRNVMVTFDGHGKVIDFGLARTSVGEWQTRPGMLLGTLRYMSPEQATAAPVDRRSDVYSFATVLYEALGGRFFVPDGAQLDILKSVIGLEPAPLTEVNPSLPAGLTPVLARAMQKAAEDRYPDAETFRQDLLAAAPELCATPRNQIGDFMRSVFPEQAAWGEQVVQAVKRQESTLVRDAPDFEPTRAGVPGMAAGDEPAFEPTRAGVPGAADLASDAIVEPEPEPQPLAADDHDVMTGTVPVGTQVGGTVPEAEVPPVAAPAPSRTPILVAAVIGAVALGLLALLVLRAPDRAKQVDAPPETAAVLPAKANKPAPQPKPSPAVDPEPTPVARVEPAPKPDRVPADKAAPVKKAPRRAAAPKPPPETEAPAAPPPPPKPADPKTAALRIAKGLKASQRGAVESCVENAPFENADDPDYAACLGMAQRYARRSR